MLPLLIQSAHWGLALVPVLILLAVFVWLDAFKLMSMREIVVLLVLGGLGALAAWPVAVRFLNHRFLGFYDEPGLKLPVTAQASGRLRVGAAGERGNPFAARSSGPAPGA